MGGSFCLDKLGEPDVMLCLFEMLNISRDAPLLDSGPWEELAVKKSRYEKRKQKFSIDNKKLELEQKLISWKKIKFWEELLFEKKRHLN